MTQPRFLFIALCVSALCLWACTASDTGAECDDDGDCETGLCFTDSNPGYCTSLCLSEGSTEECPANTVCKPIQGGQLSCILICEEQSHCPDNSDCNNVSDTDLMGCEPVH